MRTAKIPTTVSGSLPPFLALGAKRCPNQRPPRQIVSDMKWEGETWLSSEDLGSKKPRLEGQEAEERPPKPDDPEEDRDDTRRSKDKDSVPSRLTHVWKEGAWVLCERERLPVEGRFFAFSTVPPKQVELLRWIMNHPDNPIDEAFLREELVPRLNRTHLVSLRLLDWLVVDYSREKNVAYSFFVPLLKRVIPVVVHQTYESLRYRWRRRRFDCLRRRHRVYFDLDGETYSTTVAQLHFFFMSRMYGFLDYAAIHLSDIEEHMKRILTATAVAKQEARARSQKCRRKPLVTKARPGVFISDRVYHLSLRNE